MEKARILLYTDYEKINEDPKLTGWGITELKKLIVYKTMGIAEFTIDLIYRHAGGVIGSNKLTHKLLCQYDELWVFGVAVYKDPPIALEATEVEVLKEWMDKGGGLLITGDHSGGEEQCGVHDPKTFSNLGRSLGERIKRAGQLRVWEGPPTVCMSGPLESRDNYNTNEGTDPNALDHISFQSDGEAQTLLHPSTTPHRLFWRHRDASGKIVPITRFPDHPHEGRLLIPRALNDEWPPLSPFPVVAVQGSDKRFPQNPRIYNLVVAYDGDPASVGRIVADSSFHHYINVNIGGLRERDAAGYPTPDSDLDQVAQYYGNLALWLLPQTMRDEIKLGLFFRIAEHPDVFEVRASGIVNLGKVAQHALSLELGDSNLYRLFAPSEFEMQPRPLDDLLALIFLSGNSSDKIIPSEQVIVLGAIVQVYYLIVADSRVLSLNWLTEKPLPLEMVESSFALIEKEQPSLAGKLLHHLRLASGVIRR